MINIEEEKNSKSLGKTRRKTIWRRGRKGTIHPSSRIILRGRQIKINPEC
jgi:hypothetical protein